MSTSEQCWYLRRMRTAEAHVLDTKHANVQERWVIPGDSTDQRAERTRARLGRALIELMRDKDYEQIEVGEIAARARVGRSTFYRHFADKDDLLVRQSVGFRRMLGRHLAFDPTSRSWRFPVAMLFEHVMEVRFYYDALIRSRKLDRIMKIGQIVLAEEFEKRMSSATTNRSDVPIPIVAQHYASSLMNLLHWWMDHHYPYTAAEMERYFHRMVARPTRS